jgi:hypothetical protein
MPENPDIPIDSLLGSDCAMFDPLSQDFNAGLTVYLIQEKQEVLNT